MECSGKSSIDWQRRWLIRRLIKFNKNTLDKLPYPDWYTQNPTHYNSTRRPLLPSNTPETYIYDPDFQCDPYYNETLYDTEDNLQNVTQDADPDALPENQPDQPETQPEPGPNPEPSSPRKGKYNLRSNPPSNWKRDYAYYDPVVISSNE